MQNRPSIHVPGGWLRSLVHSHALFFGGAAMKEYHFMPDLKHGLQVSHVLNSAATMIAADYKP